jgi:hypothetical protein
MIIKENEVRHQIISVLYSLIPLIALLLFGCRGGGDAQPDAGETDGTRDPKIMVNTSRTFLMHTTTPGTDASTDTVITDVQTPPLHRRDATGGNSPAALVVPGFPEGHSGALSDHPSLGVTSDVAVVSTYEASDREMRRGIDPNDASTWPSDYRGPAIERAVQQLATQHYGAIRSGPRYDSTVSERQQGIDPNDPTTWPADYPGPGIERIRP